MSTTTARARIVSGELDAISVDMEVHDCPSCGQIYAASAAFFERRRADGASWPTICGHSAVYRESEADKAREKAKELERQLQRVEEDRIWYQERLRDERQQHARTKGSLTATKGALTKAKRRVAAGVCPCCQRTFQQLARHMKGQHPEYAVDSS